MELKKKSEDQFIREMTDKRIISKDKQCEISQTGRSQSQSFNTRYYEQYKKLYLTSYYISRQMNVYLELKNQILDKLSDLSKKTEEFKDNIRGEIQQRKKRNRRTAEEIQRNYICPIEICQKCYGSEGSLQQHIKLKHQELYTNKKNTSSCSNIESH